MSKTLTTRAVVVATLAISFSSGLILSKAANGQAVGGAPMVVVSAGEVHVWSPEGGLSAVGLPNPTYAADIDPMGELLAVTTGLPIHEQMEGVIGQVVVLDPTAPTRPLISTAFHNAALTGITFSPDGSRVAFIKDYREVWELNLVSRDLEELFDVGTFVHEPGGVVFDPVYALDGSALYAGVVEKSFEGGEDDKLDNLYYIARSEWDSDGAVTSFSEGPNYEDWQILRRPVTLSDGSVIVTTIRSGTAEEPEPSWTISLLEDSTPGDEGDETLSDVELGAVPSMTLAVGETDNELLFLSYDHGSNNYDLRSMAIEDLEGGWTNWCESGCSTLISGIDQVGLP